MQSSLSALSNEVFFTAWTSHWTTGLSVKSITLSQNARGIYGMSNLLCLDIPGKTTPWITLICSTIWEKVDGASSLTTQCQNLYSLPMRYI